MPLLTEMQHGLVGHLDLGEHVLAEPASPVGEVLRLMRRFDRTTALITEKDRLVGIFTERDVLQKIATRPETWGRPVGEFMTPDPTVVQPVISILGAVRVMNRGHFRDVPVVDSEGKILGNLTDNAIVRHLADRLQAEVLNLPPNPNQVPRTAEGA